LPTLDSSRIRAELGWQAQYSGADALREVMEAMAEGEGGPNPPLHATGTRSSRNTSE
jgi:UDP-glucose 4-epimerase